MVDIEDWCQRQLGSAVVDVLFSAGHLSQVTGVRLADGREVTVKARPSSPRLTACTAVQRALWQAGFPAPEPLVGPLPLRDLRVGEAPVGELAASAERYIGGGAWSPRTDPARRFAELLARLIALAPAPASVGSLRPELPWVAWNRTEHGVWPAADDRDDDLNAPQHATPWLDDTGARVRRRLAAFAHTPAGRRVVLGHGDWEAQNLRWRGDDALVVHDWDSVTCAPEPVLVGMAASVWPCGIEPRAATLSESATFVEEYQRAAGRTWSDDEVEASWAAGLWVYAFNTKKASIDGVPWLTAGEAETRLELCRG